ncbi:hypothetical protein Tco_0400604 [Tanacetum coccineum]
MNKNMDTSSRTRNDNQTRQIVDQRAVAVAGIGKLSAKRVKDYEYHKEKMMLYKKEAKGIPLSAEQSEWLQDIYDEPNEQELKAHYMYMARIHEVLHATDDNFGPTYDTKPLEKVDSNVTPDSTKMSTNERGVYQNAKEPDNERVLLSSLIANLKLDVDENKKIQKQLKKANTSLTQELDKSKCALRDCNIKLSRYQKFHTNHKEKEEAELKCKEALGLLAEIKQQSNESSKTEAYKTFCIKEENEKLVNKISEYERILSYIRSEKEEMKKDFKEQEDKDIDKKLL